jgi:peptide/nickel transport system permease protein
MTRALAWLWLGVWFGSALALRGLAALAGGTWDAAQHQLDRTLGSGCLLGCDPFGRDVLLLTLDASASSAAVAIAISSLTLLIAILLGAATAFSGALTALLLARTNDLLLAFPALLLALGWAAVRGPGWQTLLGALLLGTLPPFTRLIQTRARELAREEYVLSSHALGATRTHILRRHAFKPLLELALLKFPALFASALVSEATLSFLGLGAPLGRATWGSLLAQGKDYLIEAPWIAVTAGFPLALTILALQVLSAKTSSSSS